MRAQDIPEAAEAADPSTSPERLGNIADLYPELHPVLVLNPSCPEDLREWMRERSREADKAWKDHLAAERARQQAEAQRRAESDKTAQPSQPPGASPSKQSHPGRWLVVIIAIVGVAAVMRGCVQLLEHSGGSHTRSSATPTSSVSPAPTNAVSARLIQSPTQNISCEIDDDRASCSIYARDYGDAGLEDCDETLFSITVQDRASLACGSEYLGSAGDTVTTLDYGESAKSEGFACFSDEDGMRCWNQRSGHGFKIARAGYSTF